MALIDIVQRQGSITIAVIGCGKLGLTVLQGLLHNHNGHNDRGHVQCKQIIASVRNDEHATRVLAAAHQSKGNNTNHGIMRTIAGDNVLAARCADVIVLACHPHQRKEILGETGMVAALADKVLISMLGGVSSSAINQAIYSSASPSSALGPRCHVLQAVANIAAAQARSVTVVNCEKDVMPQEKLDLAEVVLKSLGEVIFVEKEEMTGATALCASGIAFFSWFLKCVMEGANETGLEDERNTLRMAALTMRSVSDLILSGETPDSLMKGVTSPGGVTAVGLKVLHDGSAGVSISRCISSTAAQLKARSV